MKKSLLGTLVGMVLLVTLCLSAMAADATMAQTPTASSASLAHSLLSDAFEMVGGMELEELAVIAAPSDDVSVNGVSIAGETVRRTIDHTNYVSIRSVTEALFPTAQVSWTNGQCEITAPGLTLTARPGDPYLVVNGRYLYVPDGILFEEHSTLAPVRALCTALGADVSWDAATNNIAITDTAAAPLSGAYPEESLYWLSRVISAESGNQPLVGKVAVGTVILNRVESALFPDTVRGVVFDCRYGSYQFSTVPNGSIYKTPNEASVIAAKLCLDGAREAGDSLYFNVGGLSCWASKNRPYAMTIADHDFYL